jgi:YbbR domain-containing protein
MLKAEASMKKFSLRKILYNDQRLKLFAIIAAFLFWFIIVSYISPDYTVNVNNVPITVEISDLSLSSLKLSVIQKSQKNVSLEVSGPRYLIGKLSAKDFIVRPRFTQVTSSGKVNVDLTADFVNPDARLRIKKISPSYVNIYIDRTVTKTIPVEVVVQSSKIADGYIMQNAVVDPKTINVTGPEQEMANVSKAIATVKIRDNASEIVTTNTDVVVYNSNNKPTDITFMKLNISKANVIVPILLAKSIPLSVSYKNLPAGFDPNNISSTITPSNVRIAGTTDVISAITKINLSEIDFLTLDITNTLKFDLPLPAGTSDIDNAGSASVNITLNNMAVKAFSTKKITAVNVPSGLSVIIKTKQLNNIQLYGSAADIASITNLEAIADMSKVQNGVGQYQVPVTISVPDKSGFWVRTPYYVLVYVYKK